jgi:hypothetical protein
MTGSDTGMNVAVREGKGFVVDRDGLLTSTLVNRKLAVTIGVASLALYGWFFYLDWHRAIDPDQWWSSLIDILALLCIGVGLISIGLRKQVKLSSEQSSVWQEAGWFGLSTSAYETSAWPLARFDRIIIQRTNLLGFEARTRSNPRQAVRGVRFWVKLMGNSEVGINAYADYNEASQLAQVLSSLTGYPVRDVN